MNGAPDLAPAPSPALYGGDPPGLAPRFLPPPGWRWGRFESAPGRVLRYGGAVPEGGAAGHVVGLQGLGEFAEKYFETARDVLARGFGFWMTDWHGQGRSGRAFAGSQKRHAEDFGDDVADLHAFLSRCVLPAAGGRPLYMLGHSMGGHIGLRHLGAHPGLFVRAGFSAPLLRIAALRAVPQPLSLALTGLFKTLAPYRHVGFGPAGWDKAVRDDPAQNIYSGDETRRRVHNAWCLHDPALQSGAVTYGWIHAANASCARLRAPGFLESIRTPCLFACAGREALVDNRAIADAAAAVPGSRLERWPQARHEILMETDGVRNGFLAAFFAFAGL